MNYIEIINELNEIMASKGYYDTGFSYATNGLVDVIMFEEIIIYSSDIDLVPDGDIKDEIMIKFNNKVDELFNLKF